MRILRHLAAAGTLCLATTAQAQVVYSNDFSSNSNGFNATGGGTAVISTPANCVSALICPGNQPGSVLARANGNPFDNQTATLSLSNLVNHTSLTLSFQLLLISSWDGNVGGVGPDYFTVTGPGNQTLLYTTFANVPGYPQSFPSGYNAQNPTNNTNGTGASELNTLGSGWDYYGNSVYTLSFTVAHTGSSAAFDFTGSNLQGWTDEGWALDNVQVFARGGSNNVVPEPGTVALLAAGLAGLGVMARRRRA